jgi:hypothetical protein
MAENILVFTGDEIEIGAEAMRLRCEGPRAGDFPEAEDMGMPLYREMFRLALKAVEQARLLTPVVAF